MAYIINETNQTNTSFININMGGYLRRNWGWFFALGLILTVLGILSLSFMLTATIFTVLGLGIVLMGVGFMQIIEGVWTRKWGGFLLHLLIGILYLISGAILFISPGLSAISLTFIMVIFFITVGLFRVISSLSMQFKQWGWTFISGLVSMALGVMIWFSWPTSGLWIIGMFVGLDLLFYGFSILMFAIAAHKATDREILAGES
jgi:uncharacterized membrane protein HdeD (DUF308 family)